MSPIKEWNAAKVKAAIAGRVAQNMERACIFATEQAKANAPVRTGKLQRGIDYEVEARGDVIEGRVGEIKGRQGAFYAYFQELGTSKMAAHPFLRPAVFGNARRIVAIIRGEKS